MKYNKKLVIPLAIVMSLVVVSAIGFAYFHQTNVDLTVNEARTSADVDFSVSCNSGETQTGTISISNSANVPLCSQISVTENSVTNDDDADPVIYSIVLPNGDGKVTTSASSTDTYTVDAVCNEVTGTGSVDLTINYLKTTC